MKITLILITISKKYKSLLKLMVKLGGVEVLSSDNITKIIIEINSIGHLIMEIGLIIIIIKVIKSILEIFKRREVVSLGRQELIEIIKKIIFRMMKEIIIRKVLITEVTNIATELVGTRVILGRKIIVTKIDKIITNLDMLIKKIDGMMKKEILNIKTGIMK